MNSAQNIFYSQFETAGTAGSPDSGTFSVFDNFHQAREGGRHFNDRQKVAFETPNVVGSGNKGSGGQSNVSTAAQQQQQNNAAVPKNPKLYKTELCRSWMDSGRCNYGERCQYAHGEHEKRPIPRHPKYKTEACQSYHKRGYCPYGPRCHFIHNEETMLANQQQNGTNNSSVPPMNTSNLILNMGNNQQNNGSSINRSNFSGESPAPSSNESGSESPAGSNTPPLDADDYLQMFLDNPNSHQQMNVEGMNDIKWGGLNSMIHEFHTWGFSGDQNKPSSVGNGFETMGNDPFASNPFSNFYQTESDPIDSYNGMFRDSRLPIFEQLANTMN
uniref:C3H1-type domain-containing protein n=1 Tax=Parastrongyloides trichosuri TaxID=131310 RepID=A0A0N4Z3I5_PARTI